MYAIGNCHLTKGTDKMKLYCSATQLLEVNKYGFTALPMGHVFPPFNTMVTSLEQIWKLAKDYQEQVTKSGKAAALVFYVRKERGERAFNGMDKSIKLLNRELRFANPDLVRIVD
jgi:hypothetical protein